jgi:hypothetical protein
MERCRVPGYRQWFDDRWRRLYARGCTLAGRTLAWALSLGISWQDGNGVFYLWLLMAGAAVLELLVTWLISLTLR